MTSLSSYVAAAALLIGGALGPAAVIAQTTQPDQPARPTHISGTITAVNGHLVTVQQSTGTIVINDQPALNLKTTGEVAVGRQIVARGEWRNGTFYATALQFGPAVPLTAADEVARVSGTITSVTGHLVTLQQSRGPIVINDQPALDSKTTGPVAVGRQVVAVGYWRAGTFYATALQFGLAPSAMSQPDRVGGTITAVSGHLVTLQQSRGTVVINDQPALTAKATGEIAVGRQVVALGYWQHGTFYANSVEDVPATTP